MKRGHAKALILMMALALLMRGGVSAFAAQKEADVQRNDQGVVINKDQTIAIAEDRKVYEVAQNVLRVEDQTEYLTRKIEHLHTRILDMDARMNGLESRIQALEDRPEEDKKSVLIS